MAVPQSRRHFLQAVGVTGGAGVLYSTMGALGLAPAAQAAPPFRAPRESDFTLTGRSHRSVLVLGAGIAGLATAYELRKAGYKVRVLEARKRPGGRNWTVRGGTVETDLDGHTQRAGYAKGQYLNAGPARIAQHMVTLDYCRELGVPIEIFGNQNADGYYYNEGVGPLSGAPIRHRTAKADVYGYVSELLAKATDQGALDGQLTPDDKERLLAFLRNFGSIGGRVTGDPAASWKYTGSTRRGYEVDPGAGFEAGTPKLPPHALSDVLASGVGQYFSFEFGWDQAMLMFQPVGGMDRIAYALEDAVGGERVTYGAEVRSIINKGSGGVDVVYTGPGGRTSLASADFCVCTIPPQVLAKIPSNLTQAVKDALAYAQPVSTGKIGLQYGRRWWEEDEKIYSGITNTNLDLSTIWYPSYDYHGAKGIVVGYYNFGANADTYSALTPAQRQARAVEQGVKIHGEAYRTELEAAFSVSWRRTKYSEGGWVSWPSRTSGHYGRLLEPDGNVYFAGDHLSYYIAWQAGAFESARKVVTDLHARVLSS